MTIIWSTLVCSFSPTQSSKHNFDTWQLRLKDRILIDADQSRMDTCISLNASQLREEDTVKYFYFSDYGSGRKFITRLFLISGNNKPELTSEEETIDMMMYGYFTVGKLKKICSANKSDTVAVAVSSELVTEQINFLEPTKIIKIRLTQY